MAFDSTYRPEEVERIFLENDWNDIFSDTPRRAFQTQEQKEAGSRHLLDLPIMETRQVCEVFHCLLSKFCRFFHPHAASF